MEKIKVLDKNEDKLLNTTSILIKIKAVDYIEIAKEIIDKNSFQRKKVSNSNRIYKLLGDDLIKGCIIPPIVLALNSDYKIEGKSDNEISDYINKNKNKLIILDGLQRTLTLLGLNEGLFGGLNTENLSDLRIEILIGLHKNDLLYRMLTLNTGQTPMSTRHQIEILYNEYLDVPYNNIKFFTESSNNKNAHIGYYSFRDVIDGYTSYIDEDYFSLDRNDILNTIENLRSNNNKENEFEWFISIFDSIVRGFDKKIKNTNWTNEIEDTDWKFTPFGIDAESIFVKSQVLTGLGYALKVLQKKGVEINSELIDKEFNIIDQDYFTIGLTRLIEKLDEVSKKSKKIGNGQRAFFGYFFVFFLDSRNTVTYFNLSESIKEGFKNFDAFYFG